MNTINFSQSDAGLSFVGRSWPYRTVIDPATMALAEVDGRVLRFVCINGEATYHLYGTTAAGQIYQRNHGMVNGRVMEAEEGAF